MTHLRELGVPEDIIRYWVGHAGKDITDRYSKLAENVELRKEWALRAGLGFCLDDLGKLGDPRPHAAQATKKPGTREQPRPPQIQEIGVAGLDPENSTVPQLARGQQSVTPMEPKFVASDDDLPAELFETPVTVEEA